MLTAEVTKFRMKKKVKNWIEKVEGKGENIKKAQNNRSKTSWQFFNELLRNNENEI